MAGWEDLPDVEPAKKEAWEELPDVPVRGEGPPPPEPAFDSPEGQALANRAGKAASEATESAGRSALQGVTFGFAPEIKSAAQAAADWATSPKGFKESYREHQAENEPMFEKSVSENRAANLAGSMLLPTPDKALKLINPALKLTRAGRMGAAALMGGAAGLGYGKSDLAGGDFEGAAKDFGGGAGIGLLASGAGELISGGISKLTSYFGGMKSKAASDAARIATEAQQKAERSALGSARSGAQSASRDLEVLSREAEALPVGNARRAEIEAFLGTPEALALRERVAGSKLGSAPERISEMTQLEDDYARLRASGPQNIQDGIANQLDDPIKKQVAPRLAKLAYRALPIAATGAGSMIGNTMGMPVAGAGIGMALGGVTALIMGKPGTVVANMVKSPGFRSFIGTHGEKLAEIAPAIESAAANGPVALQAALAQLRAKDPQAAALLDEAQALQSETPAPQNKLTEYFSGKKPEAQ